MSTQNPVVVDPVEANKNKLDLKPALDFVTKHLNLYEARTRPLFSPVTRYENDGRIKSLAFSEEKKLVIPQLNPENIRALLSALPPTLLRLSALNTISYQYADKVPVPKFNEAGEFTGCECLVPYAEFPRAIDHPSRILIGHTSEDGKVISPTPIPRSISTDTQAGWYYELHVFLHEFCHTLGFPWRLQRNEMSLVLRGEFERFTLQAWWNEWATLLRSGVEPRFVSRYASLYASSLTEEMEKQHPDKFVTAVAEQICESFVAYVLGIVPNDDGWADFRAESFGNTTCGRWTPAANQKWLLIHQLFTARSIA